MIPQNQLKYLTPLPDMVKRKNLLKRKGTKHARPIKAKRHRVKNGMSRDHVGRGQHVGIG